MFKNKSYIWISLVILVFGIIFIPRIIDSVSSDDIVKGSRLDKVKNNGTTNEN